MPERSEANPRTAVVEPRFRQDLAQALIVDEFEGGVAACDVRGHECTHRP
jgi:hypothetical protein